MKLPAAGRYSFMQKAAHWVLFGLCISQFPTAYAIQRTHMGGPFGIKPAPLDLFLHKVHAWGGWTILILAIIMLTVRLVQGAPALPHGMSAWQRWLAHTVHASLYGFILALAVTGTGAMYVASGFAPIHIALTKFGIALVVLHVLAVIWHQVVRRDGLLLRMMPEGRGVSAQLHSIGSKTVSGEIGNIGTDAGAADGDRDLRRLRLCAHFVFSIFVTVNCSFTLSASNFILSPALTVLSMAGSDARNTMVMPSSMSNFLIGPCLMVILPADSSTFVT
jgi:cytochrome b561